MGIFKAYDIRGIYPIELNEDICYRIGNNLSKILKSKKFVIGRDMRSSSPKLHLAFCQGIIDSGADVYDTGLISTPMFYFAIGKYKFPAGAMITASHNPKKYNGIKICKKGPVSLTYESGLKQIEKNIDNIFISKKKGKLYQKNIYSEYSSYLLKKVKKISKFHIGIDSANSTGSLETKYVLDKLPIKIEKLYCDILPDFPNHEANPMNFSTLIDLKKSVKNKKLDFGVAFDGDSDRVVFIDDNSKIVSPDIITAIIADYYSKQKKVTILYDVRSTNVISEIVSLNKSKPIMVRVGHSYIKEAMRNKKAVFAGELSGHYYYQEFFNSDSGVLTILKILEILSIEKCKLSDLAKKYIKYYSSGEINFKVKNKLLALTKVKNYYKDEFIIELDGISVYTNNYWFNLRLSNTENLARLNIESKINSEIFKVKKLISKLIK